jgi:hypothetical protein
MRVRIVKYFDSDDNKFRFKALILDNYYKIWRIAKLGFVKKSDAESFLKNYSKKDKIVSEFEIEEVKI